MPEPGQPLIYASSAMAQLAAGSCVLAVLALLRATHHHIWQAMGLALLLGSAVSALIWMARRPRFSATRESFILHRSHHLRMPWSDVLGYECSRVDGSVTIHCRGRHPLLVSARQLFSYREMRDLMEALEDHGVAKRE